MRLPAWMRRRRVASGLAITGLSLATLAMTKAAEQHYWLGSRAQQRTSRATCTGTAGALS